MNKVNDFFGLDLNHDLIVTLDFQILKDPLFPVSNFGIHFKSGESYKISIKRVNDLIEDPFELFILALNKSLGFISQIIRTMRNKIIIQCPKIEYVKRLNLQQFDVLSHKNLQIANKIIIDLHNLKVAGISVEFHESIVEILQHYITINLKTHKYIDDFESQDLLLSTTTSRIFDTMILSKIPKKIKLVQIIDDHSYRSSVETVVGDCYDRWFLNPIDYKQFSPIISKELSFNGLNDKEQYEYKRVLFCLSECDCFLLFTKLIEDSLYPQEEYILRSARILEKQIYIFDVKTSKWFSPSKNPNKSLIIKKDLKLWRFRKLSYFVNGYSISESLTSMNKLFGKYFD